MRAVRWLTIAAITGGMVVGAGPPEALAGTGVGKGDPNTFFTSIELTGTGHTSGTPSVPTGWTPPACWLEPNTNFDGSAAYLPVDFGRYMDALLIIAHRTGETAWQYAETTLYYDGIGDDPIVHMTNPPYNQGLTGGKWYDIACSSLADPYLGAQAVKQALGVTNDYEDWFWFQDGKPTTAVPVADPNLLAEYAAAQYTLAPTMQPADFSPKLSVAQTVNLPTLINVADPRADNLVDPAGNSWSITATLRSTGQSSTVTAVPVTMTIYPGGPTSSPSPITCNLSPAGNLTSACSFTYTKATATGATYTPTATITWALHWGGDPVTGEAGWTKNTTTVVAGWQPVTVQEIQTVVGGGA